MLLQADELGSALNVGQGFGVGHLLPLEHLDYGKRSTPSTSAKLSSALHARFGLQRIEFNPASQFEAACNFIAAYYVLEGEFLA